LATRRHVECKLIPKSFLRRFAPRVAMVQST